MKWTGGGPDSDWVRISMVASLVLEEQLARRLCYRDPQAIATFRESTRHRSSRQPFAVPVVS
jgi:hypothetical protein